MAVKFFLQIRNLGPVKSADITFGGLTVFVGPQAAGKSIVLQLFKLLLDTGAIHDSLARHGVDWKGEIDAFLEAYFGEGMSGLRTAATRVEFDSRPHVLASLTRRQGNRDRDQHTFYIPAQRVLSIAPTTGWLRGFTDYRPGDPFVVKDFSETLRQLADNEFSETDPVFPQNRRFNVSLRDALKEAIFGGFDVELESQLSQKRLVLKNDSGSSLPFTVWSAGQREFVPLLLGCYQLLPRAAIRRRDSLECAVIEELEMGLHPRAISAAFLLVLELLQQGYRVCLSTHSPHVLDLVWALGIVRQQGGTVQDVLGLFPLPLNDYTRKLAAAALGFSARVYYFDRESGEVEDISHLDPGAESFAEAGWGGLSEYTSRVNNVVADVVNRQLQAGGGQP